jgi:2-isopropylmalate synthase
MKKPPRIEIYDTTLRDGSQGEGVSLSLQDKLAIAGVLDSLGVNYIEAGYPLSNPKDRVVFAELGRKKLRLAKVVAFGMPRRKGAAAGATKA